MRVGVVGVGRIGSFHARVLAEHPGVVEVLVTDPVRERAEQVAREVRGRAVASVEALLPDVDAVVISSPTISHADLIRQAVDAGRPTFCEKPITIDLASTDAVIAHVRERDATLQMGFQRRFDAGYRRARELVACGTLGRIYVVRMAGHDPRPPHDDYIPGSGGIFRDLHIHDFDIARWVTGQEVVEVYADGSDAGFEAFTRHGDVATAVSTLRFDGGTLGILSGTRHDPVGYDIRMEVFGAGDSVAVGWDTRTPMRSLEPGGPAAPKEPYTFFLDRFAPAYRAELHAFVEVAAGRMVNPCPPEDAREAIRVAMACDLSRQLHRPVRVQEVG
jgi:myo-inositol 2-dehydrogenase / D-chiro-inositol 1-dehydrogenase